LIGIYAPVNHSCGLSEVIIAINVIAGGFYPPLHLVVEYAIPIVVTDNREE